MIIILLCVAFFFFHLNHDEKKNVEISLQIYALNIREKSQPMGWFLFHVDPFFLNDYILMWISNARLISNRKWKFCFLKIQKPHLLSSPKYLFKAGIRSQPFPTKRPCFHRICIFDWKPCFKVLKLDHCEVAFISNWPQGRSKLCGWDSPHLHTGV